MSPAKLLKSPQYLLGTVLRISKFAYWSSSEKAAEKEAGNFQNRTFRTKFLRGTERPPDFGKWFPQHMHIGMKVMQAKLRNVDCIIEVHDSRIPFSGRNPNFYRNLYVIKPHVLLMNKIDLIHPRHIEPVEKMLRENFKMKHILWTNLKSQKQQNFSIPKLMKIILEEVENIPRYDNNMYKTDYDVMVIGIPNTGKSTLINTLRRKFTGKKAAAKVGARPGVTTSVQEKIRIHEIPKVYVLDTPGVLAPEFRDIEVSLKMAICETVLHQAINHDIIADYLLFYLNLNRRFNYVKPLHLFEPYDSLMPLLTEICKNFDLYRKVAFPGQGEIIADFTTAAVKFTEMFRNGKFGDQFLDSEVLAAMSASNVK